MDPAIVEALLALNRTFYDKFAGDFARTRRSSPPGFNLIVPYLLPADNLVDLGCGNGRLLSYLAGRGWHGRYIGLDSSAGLLDEARIAAQHAGVVAEFLLTDLLEPEWPIAASRLSSSTSVVSLAVLHHIPGALNRFRFMLQAAQLLPPGGHFVVSTWQFMTSPRLRKRLLPWSAAHIREEDVERGDHLMSWGQGAAGQRYVAAIDADELRALAAAAGLQPEVIFTTDGLEGDLNLYGVFRTGSDRQIKPPEA